jgi:hypothetical protein
MKFSEKRFRVFKLVTPHQSKKIIARGKVVLNWSNQEIDREREQVTHSNANQANMIDVSNRD